MIFLLLCLYSFYCYTYKTRILKYHKDLLNSFERKLIVSNNLHKHNLIINFDDFYVNLNSLYVNNKTSNKVILYVHGAASSSLGFMNVMNKLSKDTSFSFHSLDLPGFGISTTSNDNKILSYNENEIIDVYNKCILEYIDKILKHSEIYLVGHSFGSFICVQFAYSFPSKIKKICLISCALMPILNEYTYYWSILFYLGFPNIYLKLISCLGFNKIIVSVLNNIRVNDFWIYYYLLLSNPLSYGEKIIRKFIRIYSDGCKWRIPILCKLLCIKKPIAFIYGKNDIIIPWNQAFIFRKLSQSNIPIHILENSGHACYFDNINYFCDKFINCLNTEAFPTDYASNILMKIINQSDYWHNIKGFYNTKKMKHEIEKLEKYLTNLQ